MRRSATGGALEPLDTTSSSSSDRIPQADLRVMHAEISTRITDLQRTRRRVKRGRARLRHILRLPGKLVTAIVGLVLS